MFNLGRFSEASVQTVLDFTACMRPDGSIYGTGGQCRKGTETQLQEESKGQPKRAKLSARESSYIDRYIEHINKMMPTDAEDIKERLRIYKQYYKEELKKARNGDVPYSDIDAMHKDFALPSGDKRFKFITIGMEPGLMGGNPTSQLASELTFARMNRDLEGRYENGLVTSIFRAKNFQDVFARSVVEGVARKGNSMSFAAQLQRVSPVGKHLSPEQFMLTLSTGNIRPVTAPGTGHQGMYAAINKQKDPKLQSFNRKKAEEYIPGRIKAIVDIVITRGKEADFQGGLMAPGKEPQTIKAVVDQFKSQGSKVVEHTVNIGKDGKTPMKTYAVGLENGKTFVILESSLNNKKLNGQHLVNAYNQVLTNYYQTEGAPQ